MALTNWLVFLATFYIVTPLFTMLLLDLKHKGRLWGNLTNRAWFILIWPIVLFYSLIDWWKK